MSANKTVVVMGAVSSLTLSVLVSGCNSNSGASNAPSAGTSLGTKIDDTVVTTRVKSALLNDPGVKSFDFKVETRKGVVQLSGFVDNQNQIDSAIVTTLAVEGVSKVDNNITLKAGKATIGNAVDDSAITTRVKSALLADPNVKSSDIAVATRKGEVQLSGFVNNQSQIDQAITVAHQVPGVTSVNNEMSIKK